MAEQNGTLGAICQPLVPLAESVEYNVEFHNLLPLDVFNESNGGDFPLSAGNELKLKIGGASIDLDDVSTYVALDIPYQQTWCLNRLSLGDIETTISLAPRENLTIRVKRTQREYFKRTHVDQRESIRSFENTIQDRDVVAVTRSSAKQFNWSVNAHADVSLGKIGSKLFNASVDTSLSGQINSANKSSVESVHEATAKSSRQLTLMSKVEITSGSERTFEEETVRELCNPYADRSLDFNIFQVQKHFDISTRFDPRTVKPVIVIEFDKLIFDNAFVRNNLSFLQEHLLEDQLLEEYILILGENVDDIANRYEPDTQKRAIIALEFLFNARNMFDFDLNDGRPLSDQTVNQSFIVPDHMDFPEFGNFDSSALNSSLQEEAGPASAMYTTLAYFYRVYKSIQSDSNEITYIPAPNGFQFAQFFPTPDATSISLGSDDDRRNFTVDLAVALAETLQAQLGGLTPENIRALVNVNRKNEIFRRLFGFVSFMHGAVVPKQTEDEEKAVTTRRFGAIETRITRHLQDYAAHYTQRYLEYLTYKTRNVELTRFVDESLTLLAAQNALSVASLSLTFDAEGAFISRNRLVVPSFGDAGMNAAAALLEDNFDFVFPENFELEHQELRDKVTLPHDGIHIEAQSGLCILADVPEKEKNCAGDFSFSCGTGDK